MKRRRGLPARKRRSASPVQIYRAFALNNAWANHRLLAACQKLSQQAFEARRTGFFPSLQLTLNHICTIDLFYIDALDGGSLGPDAWACEVPYPAVDQLRLAQVVLDRPLIAFCDQLDAAGLDRSIHVHRENHVQIERCDRLLMHLFQHQIHHRGQAHAMMADTGVEPPQLDEFFPVADLSLRQNDLAELGWSERDIWGDY